MRSSNVSQTDLESLWSARPGNNGPKVRVLVADDHALFRQSLSNVLCSVQDIEIVEEASDGDEAVEKASNVKPDLVLMDVELPGLSSFDAAKRIHQNAPQTKTLFVSNHEDEQYLIESLKSDAVGYISKDSPTTELVQAVREAASGGMYLSPRMLAHVVHDYHQRPKAPVAAGPSGLTVREREVLKCLAEGRSVKQIAHDWGLSVKTIEAHKCNLMRKLSIHRKVHLVRYALQNRIINPACDPQR